MDFNLKVGIVIFFLVSSGFVVYSYDRADEGIKLMSDDDMQDVIGQYTRASIEDLTSQCFPEDIRDSSLEELNDNWCLGNG